MHKLWTNSLIMGLNYRYFFLGVYLYFKDLEKNETVYFKLCVVVFSDYNSSFFYRINLVNVTADSSFHHQASWVNDSMGTESILV